MKLSVFKRYQTATFLCLYISYFSVTYLRKSFTFVLPTFQNKHHYENRQLGGIISGQLLAYTVSKFVSGLLVDRFSPRIILVLSVLLDAVTTLGFSCCSSLSAFTFFWTFNGLANGGAWPACAKILVSWFPSSEFGTWWSVLSTSTNVSGTMGSLLALLLVQMGEWHLALRIPALVVVFVSIFVWLVIKDKPSDHGLQNFDQRDTAKSSATASSDVNIKHMLTSSTYLVICICFLLNFLLMNGLADWGQMFLVQERSRTNVEGSMYMSSFQLGGIFGSILAGIASDHFVTKGFTAIQARLLVLCITSTLSVSVLHLFIHQITNTTTLWVINLIGGGLGFGLYGSFSILGVAAIDAVPKTLSGTAHAIAALFCNVGGVLSGYPLSSLADYQGWFGAFYLLEGLNTIAMITLILAFISERRKESIKKQL